MAIDPSLITDTLSRWQTPQFAMPDPLVQYAKLQALQNGITQQQVNQQQLQAGALDLQTKQKSIADNAAMDDAFKSAYVTDPTTGRPTLDENALYQNMSAKGLGSKIPVVQKSITDANESAVKFKKAQTDANEAAQDYLAQQLLYVKDAKYDPTTFTSTLQAAVSHGAVPPAAAAQLNQRFQQNPTAEGVQSLVDPLLAASPKVQDILTKRATAVKDIAQGGEASAKVQREKDQDFINATGGAPDAATYASIRDRAVANGVSKAVLDAAPAVGTFTPQAGQAFAQQGMSEKDREEIAQRKAAETATEADRKVTQGQRAQQIGIAGAELQLRNQEYQKKYGDALGNLSDNDKTIAGKLAAGELNPSTLGRLPNKEQILAGAIQINPNWTQATYDTKQSFTNPDKKQAQNLGTISRIVSHIGRYEQNSQQMGFAPGYALGVNLTGDQAALNEDAHGISGELEKLLTNGVGSVEQTREWQKALHSPSEGARQKAINEISQLVGGQYEGMNQTYKAGTGSDLPIEKYVSPAGQQWMKTKGINVTNAAQPAGGAGGAQPSSKPAAFKAGDTRTVNGVKYTRDDKGNWLPQ